jgi:gliding motility-associated-like protein
MKKTIFLLFIIFNIQASAQCWKTVKSGDFHTLAIKTDGTLWAWGNNNYGQLGDGTTTNKNIPTKIGNSNDWQFIFPGDHSSFAIKYDGSLWAWGINTYGILGDGSIINKNTPTRIGNDFDWKFVSNNAYNTLAQKNDNSIWAWGSNSNGTLGNGSNTDSLIPVQVGNETSWKSISAGALFSTGIKNDGTIWAWGFGTYGELGNGNLGNVNTPTQIGNSNNWASISASYHTILAKKNDGTLWGWGLNKYGELGDGTKIQKNFPIQVGTSSDWDIIGTGPGNSYGIKTNGTLWTWGDNSAGQLGNGNFNNNYIPNQIVTNFSIKDISLGNLSATILTAQKDLYSWGNNEQGQFGNGQYSIQNNTPLKITNCVLNNPTLPTNNAPIITATSNQNPYCPGTMTNIIEMVSITYDPLYPNTNAVYVQISSSYVYGQDLLTLTGNHPTIASSWVVSEGKLKLSSVTGSPIPFTDFEAAIADVKYSNSTASPTGNRSFSINLGTGSLSYLPTNKHFYEYVPNLGITWAQARSAAETRNYYGLKGYLATLTSAEEAQLAGAQAPGAGWIGGSDAAIEGQWKWVTGPEGFANGGTGTIFWNGAGNGTALNFAFWNTNNGEPNNLGDEDYAHVTAPGIGIAGSWNDLSNTGGLFGDYQPKGYIVEYGGMVAGDVNGIQISASTVLKISQINVTTPAPICGPGTVTLQATASNGTVNWYDNTGNPLGTGNSYTTPTLLTTTTYYVDAGCSTARTPITVLVNPLPIANTVTIARHCADDQNGVFSFNTATLEKTLLNGQTNITVTYFDQNNNPLKDINGNLITSPFPNSFSTKTQTIKAVVTANSPLHCFDETNIQFIVDDLPEAYVVPASLTTVCDDKPNPLNQVRKFAFNTNELESIILGVQTGMTVSYSDANNNPLPSPLPNPFVTETQNILVTVTNPLNTNCIATTTLNFTVNPLPILNDITITQCDTDLISDGKTLFNLTVNNNMISAGYQNETFTYYTTLAGATNAISTDLILNELAFENTTPTSMSIWSRVTNNATGCYGVAKIELIVPATNIDPNYKIIIPPVCDDFLDSNGNNTVNNNKRDGITTFDMTASKTFIQNLLPSTDVYTINYYRNQADALAELNVITDISNYRNIGYPNSQDIWIRIDSNLDNACYGLGPYLTLNVEALPFANTVIIPRQCDDNHDEIFTFNTAALESTLLNGQTNVTVTYFDQNNNPLKDSNGILINSPFPVSFTTASQTIKAVVTNNSALQCFDQTTIEFIVDDLPIAFAIPLALTTACDDEPNPLDQDGKFAFDTTGFEATLLGGQTGMIVKYFDENNNALPSPLPNLFLTKTQNITARVENPFNTSCPATTTLNFIVNAVPNIDLNLNGDSNELICTNLPTFFVTLNAGILDGSPTGNYNYIWTKDGIDLDTNSPTLNVNNVGVYTVEVINQNGCSRIKTITVSASNIATIDSIDIVDLTDVNSVTVNTSGPGDYEYSLDDSSNFWQDSNFFDNVPAGIHEVFINDKNGCGMVSKEIVVVGIPKYFTPNNDSFNDVWGIKGMTKYPLAEVQLFDRYGKYITTLNSLNPNWDGTLNGKSLPASDYWYVITLEKDKPAFRGHFSLKR